MLYCLPFQVLALSLATFRCLGINMGHNSYEIHSVSKTQTNLFMQFREINAVNSHNDIKSVHNVWLKTVFGCYITCVCVCVWEHARTCTHTQLCLQYCIHFPPHSIQCYLQFFKATVNWEEIRWVLQCKYKMKCVHFTLVSFMTLTASILMQVPKSASFRCPCLSKSMLSGFTSLKQHTH